MTDRTAKTMTPLEWGMLLVLALVWGGSFFFVGVAVKQLPPLTIVALRVALAALILWLCAPAMGVADAEGSDGPRAPFLCMGLVNNVIPFSLIAFGQTQLASGLASILNATTPLFTVIAGHFLTADERLTPLRLAGALCGLDRRRRHDRPAACRGARRRRAGGTGHSRRGGELCLCERVRPALSPSRDQSDRHRDGPGHGLEPDADPDRASRRSPLDPALAGACRLWRRSSGSRRFRPPSPISFIFASSPARARPMSCWSRFWRR